MKVFISWSGDRSKEVALTLREWIPDVLQAVQPWMSAADISAGARWNSAINEELGSTSFGILCLTSDNLAAPWLMFEAGALAKTINDARVCPYLIDINASQVPSGPLTQFQAKRADRIGTLELVRALNTAMEHRALSDAGLSRAFKLWWPRLEEQLTRIASTLPAPPESRSTSDILAEVLDEVRSISRRVSSTLPSVPRERPDRQLTRMHEVIRQIREDESIRIRGIVTGGANWTNSQLIIRGKSPSGNLEGIVHVTDWANLRGEELTERVVKPIIECMVENFDSKSGNTEAGSRKFINLNTPDISV